MNDIHNGVLLTCHHISLISINTITTLGSAPCWHEQEADYTFLQLLVYYPAVVTRAQLSLKEKLKARVWNWGPDRADQLDCSGD